MLCKLGHLARKTQNAGTSGGFLSARTGGCLLEPKTQAVHRSGKHYLHYKNDAWSRPRHMTNSGGGGIRAASERAVATTTTAINVYNNHQAHEFDTRWLRENCRCESCYNHATQQRNRLLHQFTAQELAVAEHQSDADNLAVKWADGHASTFVWQWLSEHAYPGRGEPLVPRQLWDGQRIAGTALDEVSYAELMAGKDADEGGLRRLLRNLLEYGVGVVRDVPASMEGTQAALERVCFIQETLFGAMWSFTADMAHGDTAYTNITIGAHTDTTYLSAPIGLQAFHILHHYGDGGQTLLVDGFHVAEQLRREDPDAFRNLCTHRIHHKYVEPGHHVVSLDPVLKVHPVSGVLEMIRYNHYDRSPISTIPPDQMADYYDALSALSTRISDPANEYWLKLEPGTLLLLDNYRVLHGRAAFTGQRRMCGGYIPRDDWLGKARILGLL